MTLCEECGFTTDGPLHRDYCPRAGAVAVTEVERRSDGSARYRIEGARGWCEVVVYASGWLGSFGGQVWPSEFPALFALVGPDADRDLITGRTSYRVRRGVDLGALAVRS